MCEGRPSIFAGSGGGAGLGTATLGRGVAGGGGAALHAARAPVRRARPAVRGGSQRMAWRYILRIETARSRMRRRGIGVAALAAVAACNGRPGGPARPPETSAAPTVVASIAAPPSIPRAAAVAPSASVSEARSPRAPGRSTSTGKDACTLLRGPIQLGLTGSPTLWMDDDGGP